MLAHALKYAAAGFSVFPLTPRMKIPLAGSNGFKDATTDTNQITRWWSEHPDANIGLATGMRSGVWVIDVDLKNGKDGAESLKAYAELHADSPSRTQRVHTPSGGWHLYIKYDTANPVRSRADVLTGVDIRGDGGYVVLPPSVTEQGEYTWSPDESSIEIADATSWFRTLPSHVKESRLVNVQAGGVAAKRDRSRLLHWDTALDTGRHVGLTIENTAVGQKYVCRCPFHDDRTKSAFFFRKSETYGFLFCSACDTSWGTEKKPFHLQNQIAALEARIAQIKEIRNAD